MTSTVLNQIICDKKAWLNARRARQPLTSFQPLVQPAARDFYQAVSGKHTAFILECKKASPSKGILRADFDVVAIANVYREFATVVSVLTDETWFQGDYSFLAQVSCTIRQPILCKDFIIDAYQLWLARYYQADAVLLMLSVLDDQQYSALAALAHHLNMGVLTEVSTPAELDRALALHARVIGINNRNLHDLSIDMDKCRQLAPRVPAHVTLISESGIQCWQQLCQLRRYVHGFLIGSALMAERSLPFALRRLIFGEHKVCGLTRAQDAQAAYSAGACWGGLIFVAHSPRNVTLQPAKAIVDAAPLRYVGVFCNAPIEDIVACRRCLVLDAIQLHGDETSEYVAQLRQALPAETAIWKAFKVQAALPPRNWPNVDRYLLDNAAGGSGTCFDWSLLVGADLTDVIVAGGLNEVNCVDAVRRGAIRLDFNSGVEREPGIKDANKLNAVFHKLRELSLEVEQ